MLVITGTQRSGTSMVARMFQEVGYKLGADWWDDQVDGGLENETICRFFREYIGDITFPFDDYPYEESYETEPGRYNSLYDFSSMTTEVVKFSYLCMIPTLITIWNKYRPPERGDVFLIMERDPLKVCKSKIYHAERFIHDSILLQQEPDVLRSNVRRSRILLSNLGYKWVIAPFETVLYHSSAINSYLGLLGVNQTISKETWEKVVDISKVRYL